MFHHLRIGSSQLTIGLVWLPSAAGVAAVVMVATTVIFMTPPDRLRLNDARGIMFSGFESVHAFAIAS